MSAATRQPYPPAIMTPWASNSSGPSGDTPATTLPRSLVSHGPTLRTVSWRNSAPALVAAHANPWSKTVLGMTRASNRRRSQLPAGVSAVRWIVRPPPETRAPVSKGYGLSAVSERPSWRAMARAWTPMRSPHGLSRGNADRSHSTTPRPARARATAAALPAGPAPITTASTRSIVNDPPRSPENRRLTHNLCTCSRLILSLVS